ncbi:MBOAT family protein [Magnetospira sp. QH-2]|uniref:MBOAT family O-acyltransferase n=1 Tax=Magnetospira sp. (strain QH-2) TaxID=1288970 RepID=UPI0003E81570|nr:MBOAT family protein [Magnetospira sp. QH-2]CCQ75485.1 putative Membrane bound O-acyl transferase MBOAT family protein [Magnetospira sp. QH-2]
MLFHSYAFMFAFLPVVLIGYRWIGRYGKTAAIGWLTLSSLVFYGWWNPVYLWLILASIAGNYLFGRRLQRGPSRLVLTLGITFNLGLLGYFKYVVFLNQIGSSLLGWPSVFEDVVLPLGISFFTFQQVAYLIDCHRRLVVPHDFLQYALFVSFFPQLIAGPIVHQAQILPQVVDHENDLLAEDLAVGLSIFIVGLFKKVVLAETMADYASPMFDAAATGYQVTFLEAWFGSLAYTLQIYFDFSGYSDMAIGLARLFGIHLPINFASPYKATSIIDFWRRWHITLSTFLRDYLYYPLGGNRKGPLRRYVNLGIVMLLGGLWHGAGWTFVFWGALHGFYLMVNHGWQALCGHWGMRPVGPRWIWRILSWSLTFLAVMIAWVFFRAENFDAAINILAGLTAQEGRLVVTISYLQFFEPLAPWLGPVGFAEKGLLYFTGREQIQATLLILGLALVMPNTQEWAHRFAPAFEKVARPRYLPDLLCWRPTRVWAVGLIAMATYALIMALQPNEFLYWQF